MQRRYTAGFGIAGADLLHCMVLLNNKAVATRERVTVQTVGKWRRPSIGCRRCAAGRPAQWSAP